MVWVVNADGSYDLETAAGALRGCWPALDWRPVRCARVEVGPDRLVYHLDRGHIELDFADGALHARLRGFEAAPHWVQPLAGARIDGFAGLFRQGIGFSGPTGPLRFAELGSQEWGSESYMLLGLFDADERVCTLAPHDHRRFLFRANLHQRCYRHNFRNREIEAGTAELELGFRTERIAGGDVLELPPIHLREGDGLFATLRETARDLAEANGARAPSPPRYHYCAWYHHFAKLTDELFVDAVDRMAAVDPERHVQAAQIDDGYCQRGDWLTFNERWPRGLQPVFAHVRERGYTPGIWVAPFMVGSASRLAREHPDWLLRWNDGSLVTPMRSWKGGSPDFEHYVLDTSHPEAMAWVREVFATFRDWGVRVFKTDFLEWGYRDSSLVRRHTPGKTGAQHFDEVMATIRAAIGEDSEWLGCITYFAPSIGYVDSMRTTSDVGISWSTSGGTGNDGVGGGTENMIQESYATLYLNNVLWQNDPDVVFVRDWHVEHSEAEIRSLVRWHGLLGHSVNTSCEIGDLPPDRLRLWRWMRPQAEPWTAHLPYFAHGHVFRIVVRDYPQANGQALLILNEHGDERTGIVPIAACIGEERAVAYRWHPGETERVGEVERLVETLPAHHSLLYFLSRDGAPPPAALNLGGSWAEGG